jgi:hypothetical protein
VRNIFIVLDRSENRVQGARYRNPDRAASRELIISCRLQVASYKLQVARYKLQVARYKLQVAS